MFAPIAGTVTRRKRAAQDARNALWVYRKDASRNASPLNRRAIVRALNELATVVELEAPDCVQAYCKIRQASFELLGSTEGTS